MTSTLRWRVGSQYHSPAALPPGKTRYPLYRMLGGPQGRSGRVRKISPPPGFDPRTVQPVASRYTDWAIPALTIIYKSLNIFQFVVVSSFCLFRICKFYVIHHHHHHLANMDLGHLLTLSVPTLLEVSLMASPVLFFSVGLYFLIFSAICYDALCFVSCNQFLPYSCFEQNGLYLVLLKLLFVL